MRPAWQEQLWQENQSIRDRLDAVESQVFSGEEPPRDRSAAVLALFIFGFAVYGLYRAISG
jgi:hypothetical protein